MQSDQKLKKREREKKKDRKKERPIFSECKSAGHELTIQMMFHT